MNDVGKKADLGRESGLSLTHVLSALYRRALLVAICPLALALLIGAISLLVPNAYEATTTLQVDARTRPNSETNAADGANTRHVPNSIELQVERLRSPAVLAEVVKSQALDGDPEFSASWLTRRIREAFGLEASPQSIVEHSLWRRLIVSEMRKTNIVSISFSSQDPDKSARIANAVGDAYLRLEAAEKWPASSGDASNLSGQSSASQRGFDALIARFGLSARLADTRVLSRAEAPVTASAPLRIQWLTIAAAIGLILSSGLALLLEATSPVGAGKPHRRSADELPCGALSSLPSVESADVAGHCARLVVDEPDCAYSRGIGDTVNELQIHDSQCRVVLVASSVEGEGSEHVASNIAHHLALRGGRTLLVDADARTRLLTRQLQAGGARGLLDQLARQFPVEDALLRDSSTGLHFLPASAGEPVPITPSEALKSAVFDAALACLRRRFDFIVVSAPPLLPVIDSKLIAERVDHILFVTSQAKTEPQTAEAALRTLGRLRGKVSGAVVTDATTAEDPDRSVMGLAEILLEARQAVGALAASRKAA